MFKARLPQHAHSMLETELRYYFYYQEMQRYTLAMLTTQITQIYSSSFYYGQSLDFSFLCSLGPINNQKWRLAQNL